jgi:hypothetical protein
MRYPGIMGWSGMMSEGLLTGRAAELYSFQASKIVFRAVTGGILAPPFAIPATAVSLE